MTVQFSSALHKHSNGLFLVKEYTPFHTDYMIPETRIDTTFRLKLVFEMHLGKNYLLVSLVFVDKCSCTLCTLLCHTTGLYTLEVSVSETASVA